MMAEILVLRLVHVLGGIFWVGAMLYNAFFLMPAMVQAGAAAGPVMAGLQQRKLFTWMPVVAILTMLAGIRLMMIGSQGFDGTYFATPMGRTYLGGGVLAILGFVVGLTVARPAMMRAGELSQAMASADEAGRAAMQAELATLRKRGATASTVVTWMLIAAAAAMAVARYV
jgi:uncharacterized membrane protein